jgi:hypothetical protein
MITMTLTNTATVRNMTLGMMWSAAKDSSCGDSLNGARLPVTTAPEAQIAVGIRQHSGPALGTVPSQLQRVAVAAPIALGGVAPPRQR